MEAATKKRGGRPKKAEGDKLEQFSIRLSPKLKFGLELLARAQGRSLSQAVEWAIQVGLNSFRVNNDFESVADVLDRSWDNTDPFDRLYSIYLAAPNLLPFEDRVACEVVERSHEKTFAEEHIRSIRRRNGEVVNLDFDTAMEMAEARKTIYMDFVRALWPAIREAAVEHVASGKSMDNVHIMRLLDVQSGVGFDEFAQMKSVADYRKGLVSKEEFGRHGVLLDNSLPWSKSLGYWDRALASGDLDAPEPPAMPTLP